jgi:hypothetical protein
MNTQPLLRRASQVVFALCLASLALAANDRAIEYRGLFRSGGGNLDPGQPMELLGRLYTVPVGGIPFTYTVAQVSILDTNGLFRTLLDFGPNAFGSDPRWLELGVRRLGTSNEFTILAPRQRIAPVPTALLAQQSLTALSYTGTVTTAQLPANVARLDVPQVFTAPPSFVITDAPPFSCVITMTVANLSADLLDGLDSAQFWRRETNGGVSRLAEPANLPFEVRVQNRPVFRLQEGYSNLGWSLLADPANGNTIRPGVAGSAAIGRGGLIESNADYSFAAGDGNRILTGARNAAVFGAQNRIASPYSGAHGYGNVVSSNSPFSEAHGGSNTIQEHSDFASVSGHQGLVGPNAAYSVVGGGSGNKIQSATATIGGGQNNEIQTAANGSTVGGGSFNKTFDSAQWATVGGGYGNEIQSSARYATISGGQGGKIHFNAYNAFLGGGQNNVAGSNTLCATVPGGANNLAAGSFSFASGQNAKAIHPGSWVWADMSYADFSSLRANEVAVRAGGGVRFETAGAGLWVDGIRHTNMGGGLVLTAGSVNTSNLMDGAVLAEILDDDGAGSGLDADRLDGFNSEDFWRLTGNANTTPGVNFLGTTDNQALELKVDHLRALRLQPDDEFICDTVAGTTGLADSPSLVAGYSGNSISAGVPGAIIAGGGAAENPCLNGPGVPMPNTVTAPFASILGGLGNANHGALSAIGGGVRNTINSGGNYSHIANGVDNLIDQTDASSILGGAANRINFDADAAVIAGGQSNLIETNADNANIGGGSFNSIHPDANDVTVAGGSWNSIGADADFSFIGGGSTNRIHQIALASVIGGGTGNLVAETSHHAVIAGGKFNLIETGSPGAGIGGGVSNTIRFFANSSVVAGGQLNAIGAASGWSSIGGGLRNSVAELSGGVTIAGGSANRVGTETFGSTVGGGYNNVIEQKAEQATIGGGGGHVINTNADYATIPGGSKAAAINYGQMAYASGAFASAGDAQFSLYVLRRTATTPATAELFLDGDAATQRMKIPTDGTWTFDILVSARTDAGASAGYRITGVIRNNAGATALVGVPTKTELAEAIGTWDVWVEADDVNDALVIKATPGGTSTPAIRWVATVRTTEVVF